MILHRIEVFSVGPFTGAPAVAGPFAPGLNVLAAPNETGKTTLLKAAGRALFDRHTCTAAEIKTLRPAGTALAPSMSVEFGTGAGRFRIDKTFLQGPRSQLHEWVGERWKPLAEGDAADERLLNLLQSTKPNSGATKAAHWGMLGYLWMRQGEPSEWPEWGKSDAGKTVQSMLVKVEIDPFIEAIRERLWSIYAENFTPKIGDPKVGGELRATEEALAKVDEALAEIEVRRRELAADETAYARLAGELPDLEAEFAVREGEAAELREAAGRAEVLNVELQKRRDALEVVQSRVKAIHGDLEMLKQHDAARAEARTKLAAAEAESERHAPNTAAARERLEAAQKALDENAAALARQQEAVQRAGRLVRYREGQAAVERIDRTLARCEERAAALVVLVGQRNDMPTVAASRLKQLEKLAGSVRDKQAKIDALGLTLELLPTEKHAGIVSRSDDRAEEVLPPIAAGEARTVRADQTIRVELPGWGSVRVRSGSEETRSLRTTLAAEETALRDGLAESGARSLDEAREFAERARDLDRQIAAAREALADALDNAESMDALRAKAAHERRQLQAAETALALGPEEIAASVAELEAAEQTAAVQYETLRTEGRTLERRLKECREAVAEDAARSEKSREAIVGLRHEARLLEEKAAALRGRYPGGIEAAFETAENAFLETRALHREAEGKLPAEAASLPERNRRAATAAAQVRADLERKRLDLASLRGRLELHGAQALYSRETDLLAERGALAARAEHARRRSRSARLVHDLIERRKQAATRAVLAPLQDRLSARFGEVSGELERRIFLDESLHIEGLGRQTGELVRFDDLSQGAKEQLLLCLRLAVAEELAANGNGPQTLILDDVLVNTDAARQRRVLDTLSGAAANGLQILICTCHPDRYRGVGEVVELRRGAGSQP